MRKSSCIEIINERIPMKALGYLLDSARCNWSVSRRENIELGPDHRQLIEFVRECHEARHSVPEARRLSEVMSEQQSPKKVTRRYLHQSFFDAYSSELCKIADMTMPHKVMLDV